MKSLTLALAAAAVAGVATPALAQTDGDAPFTGPHVELHGGWNWLNAHTRTSDGDTVTHSKDHNNDGFFGGQIGYDRNFGGVLAGVFASYDVSNNEECATAGTVTGCFKANRNIEAGARVGKVLGGNNLLYVKGAYVNGKFGASASDTATDTYVSDHEKRDGWRAGVGIEHQLGRYAYVKLEYNYSRYGRFHGELGPEDIAVRVNRQEALGGIGIRF
jgi:outer membrane immunogenic protein